MNAASHSDVLPIDVAEALRERFVGGEWRGVSQAVQGHYSGPMRFDKEDLPGKDEIITASFARELRMEQDPKIHEIIREHIFPVIRPGRPYRGVTMRCYRMTKGDHFRTHSDHELGPVSFVYYLSKGWRWDWGGLLIAVDDEAKPFMPRFNSMVVMGERVPHMVTEVAPWAQEPRYMLAGFIR